MATVAIPANTSALLLDIEGTTTPITFVKVGQRSGIFFSHVCILYVLVICKFVL